MRMTDHAANAKDEYHFESSKEYCDPSVVEKAAKLVMDNMSLTAADVAQLKAIVMLERLRFDFVHSDQDIKDHARDIQALRKELIAAHHREPFDNGDLEKAFYKALNKAYGYAG
ncbi:hypothetical protein [Pseudomonas sp.]|uniref:hypothetical protein n=1 Tax=Pseudomonas sp. TaxID=306 RepID=UPI003BB63745